MDTTDWAIIRILEDDARITNRDLAARVHVSTSTSSERTRALFAEGVISGYHASVAMDALSRHVQALVAITVRPPTREHIEGFRNWAAGLPEVMSVFVVSGTATSCCMSASRTPTRCMPSSSTASPSGPRSTTSTPPCSTNICGGRCSSL